MALVFAVAAVAVASAVASAEISAPWQDPSKRTSERVENLISLLTLEEKVQLLQAAAPAIKRLSLEPYSFGRECERGDTSGKTGTAYPSGIAMASSFDVELVWEVAHQTAVEVRGNGASHNPSRPLG
jgi:beta-glucosidase